MSGLLISFDGTDSSGKETQSRLLTKRLLSHGRHVYRFATPDYQTRSGRVLKKRLQNKIGDWASTPWLEKLKYFSANRAEHREEVINALNKGDIIIYDRYVPSSLAFIVIEALSEDPDLERPDIYQAVRKTEYEDNGMPLENISIFLDVPPQISTTLLEKRKEKLNDKDEYTDHIKVQQRLYNEYDLLCQSNPGHYLRIKCAIGNSLLGINDTAELIWTGLLEKFPALADNN
ncbi:MAG: hypothetical protein ABIH36_00335 [bacterium]